MFTVNPATSWPMILAGSPHATVEAARVSGGGTPPSGESGDGVVVLARTL
jgi:hypothetical protein